MASGLKISNLFKGDRTLWGIFFFLILISLVEVFSAGSSLSFKSGDYFAPLFRQGLYIFLGFILMVGAYHTPCRYFKFAGVLGVIVCWLFLFGLGIAGSSVNGGARWIDLGFMTVQPSEFIKPAVIAVTASFLSKLSGTKDVQFKKFCFGWVLLIGALVVGVIFSENFSTAALVGLTLFLMMIYADVPWKWLGKITGGVILIAVLGFFLLKSGMLSSIERASTWQARIERFTDNGALSPVEQNRPDLVDLDRDGQESHAKIAVATSGFFGKGPGNSVQRDYLSQAYSDFIFAIIIEEFGLAGAILVLFLYGWLFTSCYRIAKRCKNTYPAYLILGLATIILLQALVNMAVAVGLIPITGQNLPLISRGGSSMMASCIMFGMMLSVSRFARREMPPKELAQLSAAEREEELREADFASLDDTGR